MNKKKTKAKNYTLSTFPQSKLCGNFEDSGKVLAVSVSEMCAVQLYQPTLMR